MKNNFPTWLCLSSPPLHFDADTGERTLLKKKQFPSVTLNIRSALVLLGSLTDLFDATKKKTYPLSSKIQV